jgi:tetratricopeptide (TPR) repeat protein
MKPGRIESVSDRTLNRLLVWGGGALAVCVIAFSVFYYFDQRVSSGPSIAERQVEQAEAAVVESPSNIGLRVALAEAYQMDNRLDDSLTQYGEVLRVEPDHRAALLGKGRLLYAKGDVDNAVEPLDKIARTALKGEFAGADVQLQEALYYLGAIDLQKGRAEDAITHLERSLSINPADSDAHFQLGSALMKAGRAKDAVPEFRTAVLFVPTDWCEPYNAMAAAFAELKDAAGQQYAQAMAQFCQGDPDGATQALTGLAEGTQGVDAMVGLGLIAEKAADRQKAAEWYQKALDADSENVTAASGLARLAGTSHSPTSTSQAAGESSAEERS